MTAVREESRSRGMPPFLREFAVQDWIVAAYATLLAAAVLTAAPHPARASCARHVLALTGAVLGVLCLVRGRVVTHPRVAPTAYRLALYGGVQLSYFLLRGVLPVVSPAAFDAQLHALDMALFGVEPAIALDRLVGPATTEWFAFFYLCYFPLLACYVIPLVFVSTRLALVREFATGIVLIYCTGQLLYVAVPAWGPYHWLADSFPHPLPRGPWHDTVLRAVAFGGAQKDVFPSLHTAGPLFLSLFAFRHRAVPPFRYTWHVTAFVAANIVFATVFLRWHYAVDVIAGAVLALGAFVASVRLPPWEAERRRATGAGPVFPDSR